MNKCWNGCKSYRYCFFNTGINTKDAHHLVRQHTIAIFQTSSRQQILPLHNAYGSSHATVLLFAAGCWPVQFGTKTRSHRCSDALTARQSLTSSLHRCTHIFDISRYRCHININAFFDSSFALRDLKMPAIFFSTS